MAWTDQISPAQRNLIAKLRNEREIPAQWHTMLDEMLASNPDRKRASAAIDRLMTRPELSRNDAPVLQATRRPIPDVPHGGYALVENGTTKFYEVDRPTRGKYAGRTFLSELQGDNHAPIKIYDQRDRFFAILDAIATDPEAALRRYGHHRKVCGHCHTKLTDAFSRFFGVGPVCSRKRGLPFSFASYLKARPDEKPAVDAWLAEDARINGDETAVTTTPVRRSREITAEDLQINMATLAQDQERRRDEMDTLRGEVTKIAQENAMMGDTTLRSEIITIQRALDAGNPLGIIIDGIRDDELINGDIETFAIDYARAESFLRA